MHRHGAGFQFEPNFGFAPVADLNQAAPQNRFPEVTCARKNIVCGCQVLRSYGRQSSGGGVSVTVSVTGTDDSCEHSDDAACLE
jgi:hypothetical protein